MTYFDLSLEELQAYKPPRQEENDFDSFWAETLAETEKFNVDPVFVPITTELKNVQVFDVEFSGFAGQRIKAWLLLPMYRKSAKVECIVEFIGYGGGRGFPWDWLLWSAASYGHFIMDTRGQGSAWLNGDTPDNYFSGPSYPGFMTRGIESQYHYYYRRLIVDAVRAVAAVKSYDAVNKDAIALTGISQGGGLCLAVAALVPDVRCIMPDVPFLCHFKRALAISGQAPYSEIVSYLKTRRDAVDKTLRVLSYFDGVNFASRITCPALYSVGLMDTVCPPSTVFAAYNWHCGNKQIKIYSYNNHEGGGGYHVQEKLQFARRHMQ